VLPASQINAAPELQAARRDHRTFLLLLVVFMLFTLLIGWAILGGAISPVTAYLWMALACLFPIAWFSYGFLKVADDAQDFGLLLSAVGWSLVAVALLLQYSAARTMAELVASGVATEGGTTPGARICGILAALCLIAGAVLSLRSWDSEVRGDGRPGEWSGALRSARDR
jgi:hypothetical protein